MRAEQVEDAAGHLGALADEVESTRGRIRLTRDGHPDLVLMSADELVSLEETLFWSGVELRRAAAGERTTDDGPDEVMTADEARKRLAHLLPPRDG